LKTLDNTDRITLDHSSDEFVDGLLSVTPVTTLVVWVSLFSVATLWWVELERPDGVVGNLEVGSNVGNFFNEILNGENVLLSKNAFDDVI